MRYDQDHWNIISHDKSHLVMCYPFANTIFLFLLERV